MFSTKASRWGHILGNADSTPIRLVYHSDASGTTELLANFLERACPGYGFAKSNTFTTVVASVFPGGLPSNWVAAKGSSGVEDAMYVDGSFSYLSPAYNFPPDDAGKVAKINGLLPTRVSLPDTVRPPDNLWYAKNPLNWVPAYVLPPMAGPKARYPIYGTTNLLLNQCYADGVGAGSVGAAVKDFVVKLNNGSYDIQINIHQFIKLPANWINAIKTTFIDGDVNGLNIGNTSVCNGTGRPS